MTHIQHLIEDRDITLGTIKDIIDAAANGNLPNVTEKLDGVNIVFTCTPRYETRFARSDSDIRNGGMIRAVLEAKFTGRGLVQETFVEGSNAIAAAIRHLSPLDVRRVFDDGKLWYSAEIIYTKNPNVVQYASNAIVFHERPVLRLNGFELARESNVPPFGTLDGRVLDMDLMAQRSGWRVHGPQRVCMKPLEDLSEHQRVTEVLATIGPSHLTLQDHLRAHARVELSRLGVSGSTLDSAIERLVDAPGCPSLTTLKPKLPTKAAVMLRDSDNWASKRLATLELAISRFASAVLRDLTSVLVTDNAAEARRIDERLAHSMKLVTDSKIPEAIELLNKHLPKVERITTPVEGIVFPWGDRLYKLTGAFAPASQIMGLVKYGRGRAIPPIGG